MKLSFTGTPRMPPFLLMSSAIISAAFLPGTPNTEAGPERKVVIAILSSAGLSWAAAGLDSNPANSIPASEAFSALRMTVIEPSPPNGTFFFEAPLHLAPPPRRRSIRLPQPCLGRGRRMQFETLFALAHARPVVAALIGCGEFGMSLIA